LQITDVVKYFCFAADGVQVIGYGTNTVLNVTQSIRGENVSTTGMPYGNYTKKPVMDINGYRNS
jgi:hypothetical protein